MLLLCITYMLFVQIHDGCAQVGCNFGNMYGKHCNYPMIYTFQVIGSSVLLENKIGKILGNLA